MIGILRRNLHQFETQLNLLPQNGAVATSLVHQLTVDERLVIFWGHCPFKMFIPNKPEKYGMKILFD